MPDSIRVEPELTSQVEALKADTQARYELLQTILRDMESVLVAYSGRRR